MPAGYADVRDPKDAPVGRLKCRPSVGFSGDVSVKPSRFRVVAMRIVNIVILVDFDNCLVADAESSSSSSSCKFKCAPTVEALS